MYVFQQARLKQVYRLESGSSVIYAKKNIYIMDGSVVCVITSWSVAYSIGSGLEKSLFERLFKNLYFKT